MAHTLRSLVIAAALPLLAVGCNGGGGGFFSSLFGGGDSGSSEVLSSLGSFFSSGGGSDGSGGDLLGSVDDGGAGGPGLSGPSVATLHHPEPASLVLFGGGLAAMTRLRRRQRRSRAEIR